MTPKNQKHSIKIVTFVLVSLFFSNFITVKAEAEENNSFFTNLSAFFSNLNDEETKTPESFPTILEIEPRKTVTTVFTAYSSDVAQTDDTPCIPAMHTYNLCENYEIFGEQDTIATNFLPLGTKVKIPELYGDKIFTVRDRMNSRYGYGRADIWMPSYEEAKSFGVKKIAMEIYYR